MCIRDSGKSRGAGGGNKPSQRIGEAANHGRCRHGGGSEHSLAGLRRERGQNLFFERPIEQQDGQLAFPIEQRLDKPPPQRLARGFDQGNQIFIHWRGFQQRFENRAPVSYTHLDVYKRQRRP